MPTRDAALFKKRPDGRRAQGMSRGPVRSHFFHLDDSLPFIGTAIQTGIVRQLQFMALRAH
jgi:hypothetical protein